jgi:hypothetical protein
VQHTGCVDFSSEKIRRLGLEFSDTEKMLADTVTSIVHHGHLRDSVNLDTQTAQTEA